MWVVDVGMWMKWARKGNRHWVWGGGGAIYDAGSRAIPSRFKLFETTRE